MNLDLKTLAIGVAAGIAAALLSFGSVVPSAFSLALFLIAPLPVMTASLGWGPGAGLAAIAAAFLAVAGFGGLMPAIIVTAIITLPAAAMAYFANLARTSNDGGKDWFPLSGILFRGAILVAAGFVLIGVLVGYSNELLQLVIDEALRQVHAADPQTVIPEATKEALRSFLGKAIPFAQPASSMFILVGNFYLALFLARKSEQAVRPRDFWPHALRLPQRALPILATAAALSFFGGTLGLIASVPAGALAAGFVMSGVAFWHAATLGKSWRTPALTATYLGMPLLLGPLVILFLLVGLFATAKPNAQPNH